MRCLVLCPVTTGKHELGAFGVVVDKSENANGAKFKVHGKDIDAAERLAK